MRASHFFCIALCSLLGGSAFAEWPEVPFATVRAYAWPLTRNEPEVITPHLHPAKGALDPRGIVLTPPQVQRLLLAEKRRFAPRPAAGCYVPHNAFVFFSARGEPVAFLEICFDCLGVRLSPTDPDCDPDFLALGALCAELKLPFGRFKSLAEFRAATAPLLNHSR